MLFLTLLLVVVALTVLLWAGTTFWQGYVYTEPAAELYWRAPAAAGGVGLVLAVWCLLAYNDPTHPERYDSFFKFSPGEDVTFNEFWSRTKLPNGQLGPEIPYRKQGAEFRNPIQGVWKRNDYQGIVGEVIIPLDGQKVAFVPEVTDKGKLKLGGADTAYPGEALYVEKDGSRTITEGQIRRGALPVSSSGVLFVYFLLNLALLVAFFLGLWLLLRFQWPHALGLGVALWLLMTVVVLPMLLVVAQDAGKASAAPERETTLIDGPCYPGAKVAASWFRVAYRVDNRNEIGRL